MLTLWSDRVESLWEESLPVEVKQLPAALAAIINNEVITVGGHGVVVWDITAWGWGHLILGTLVALTGLGLLSGRGWARVLGIVFVSINLLVQFGTFTLFPLWSMMIIAIDIVILYQLTARWETA